MQYAVDMKRGRFWPMFVIALLGANAVGVGILIYVSATDPSHHVEPDYYRRALAWDDEMAQERTNAALGWRIDLDLAPSGRRHHVLLRVRLRDRSGANIHAARVGVAAFHKARAGHVVRAQLLERQPGRYTAHLPLQRAGIWQLDFDIRRGEQRFTQRREHEVLAARIIGAASAATSTSTPGSPLPLPSTPGLPQRQRRRAR